MGSWLSMRRLSVPVGGALCVGPRGRLAAWEAGRWLGWWRCGLLCFEVSETCERIICLASTCFYLINHCVKCRTERYAFWHYTGNIPASRIVSLSDMVLKLLLYCNIIMTP